MEQNFYPHLKKLHPKRLVFFTLLFLSCVAFSAKAFDSSDVIQSSDIRYEYDKINRQMIFYMPYVINADSYDWLHRVKIFEISADEKTRSQHAEFWFYKNNRTKSNKIESNNNYYDDSNLNKDSYPRYYGTTVYNGWKIFLSTTNLYSNAGFSYSSKKSAKFIKVVLQLPANYIRYGENVKIELDLEWAPNDYSETNKEDQINDSRKKMTDWFGVLNFKKNSGDPFSFNFSTSVILNKPIISAITPLNNHQIEISLSNYDKADRYNVRVDLKNQGSYPFSPNKANGVTRFMLNSEYSDLNIQNNKIVIDLKEQILKNWLITWIVFPNSEKRVLFSDLLKDPSKYDPAYKGFDNLSEEKRKEYFYKYFLESEISFEFTNSKKLDNGTLYQKSDAFVWKPYIAQIYNIHIGLSNSSKQFELTWETPAGNSQFATIENTPFLIERKEENGEYKKISVTSTKMATLNNIDYYKLIDKSGLKEGFSYTYRITRPPKDKTGWTGCADDLNTVSAKFDFSKYIPSLCVDPTHGLYWTKDENLTKVLIWRKKDGDKTFERIAEVQKADLANFTKTDLYPVDYFGYLDGSLEQCTKYVYYIEAFYNEINVSSNEQNTETKAENFIIDKLNVSKGLYSNKIELNFVTRLSEYSIERRKIDNSNSQWQILYKEKDVFGRGGGINDASSKIVYADETASPGDIYEYKISYEEGCQGDEKITRTSESGYGFRRSSSTITGRITYAGGASVQDVRVKAKATGEGKLNNGKSLTLLKSAYAWGANVKLPNDVFKTVADFTFQSWVYCPEDTVAVARISDKNGKQFETSLKIDNYARKVTVRLQNNIYTLSDSLPKEMKTGNNWYHLGITRQGNTLKTYIDGELQGTQTSIANGTSTADSTSLFFLGTEGAQIDEVRFWSRALSDKEMLNTYCRFISGEENGLLGYWKFDERIGNGDFFDYSFLNKIANEHHGKFNIAGYDCILSTISENDLSLSAITDVNGNYIISGVPFLSDGTTYRIIPLFGTHSFNPVEEILFIDPSAYVHNKINFTDVSSFPVTGQVLYENTSFPVEKASVYVDGTMAIKNNKPVETDQNGLFTVDVPIGNHYVEVKKAGHGFKKGGRFPEEGNYTFNRSFTIADAFLDSTKVRVLGRVAGGPVEAGKDVGFGLSKNNVGKSSLSLRARYKDSYPLVSESGETRTDTIRHFSKKHPVTDHFTVIKWKEDSSGKYEVEILPDPQTGEFFADLIPENFNVEKVIAGKAGNLDFELPSEQLYSIDLFDRPAASAYIEHELPDSVLALDPNNINGDKIMIPLKDSVSYCGISRQYIRRNTPQIDVVNNQFSAIDPHLFGEEKITFSNPETKTEEEIVLIDENLKQYKMNKMPVFRMGHKYNLKVSVFEEYTNDTDPGNILTDRVPVIDGTLEINNGFDANERRTILLDKNGTFSYVFKGGSPSMSVDENDGMMNYTKTFNITAYTGHNGMIKTNWKPENSPLTGYLLGASITGSNFTTKGPKTIVTVLRDPPGSNSSSTFEQTITTVHERVIEQSHGLEVSASIDYVCGVQMDDLVGGIGFGIISKTLESENNLGIGIETTHNWVNENTSEFRTSFNAKYSTSEESNWVGAMADLIIGYGENIVYSEAAKLNIFRDNIPIDGIVPGTEISLGNGYYLAQRNAIDVSPAFDTHFMYSATGIELKVIPDLKKLRDAMIKPLGTPDPDPASITRNVYISTVDKSSEDFGELNHYKIIRPSGNIFENNTDSINVYNEDIAGWLQVLKENEQDKWQSFYGQAKNLSFESGSIYEYTATIDTTSLYRQSYEGTINEDIHTSLGFAIKGVGLRVNAQVKQVNSFTFDNKDSDIKTIAYSYKLADADQGDFYTVDVFSSPKNWGPVFRTRAGQTSCPYESTVYAKYFEPESKHILSFGTAQIEKPRLTIEPATVSNVPGNKAAIFKLVLENESDTKDGVFYLITVNESTNPDGAILEIDGLPIGNGRKIFIPAGEKTNKTLSLRRTKENVFDYKNIEIEIQSICQCDPSANDYWPDIKDSKFLTANFVPSCGDIQIANIDKVTIINKSRIENEKNTFSVQLRGYDRNNTRLQGIMLQYKTPVDSKWNTLVNYNVAPLGDQLMLSGDTIAYDWNLTDVPNNTYLIRGLAYGTGTESSETEILQIIKDDKAPKVFGKPQPASGILSAEDDISITFDEEIDASLINPALKKDIQVTGYLHGAKIAHESGIAFDGISQYMVVPDKVNMNERFTVDFWMKRDRMNTREVILSHGEGIETMEMGFTADNKVFIKLGGKEYASTKAIAQSILQDDWAHVGIVVDGLKATVYINSDEPIKNITQSNLYSKMSVLTLGRNAAGTGEYFKGKIHGLRVWSAPLSVEDNAVHRDNILTGKENNLYACWDLDEATGSVAKDKVRNREAQVMASWFVDPIGLGMGFNGTTQYLRVPMKNTNTDTDYTLEMWFKGGNEQSFPSSILSNGKGKGFNEADSLSKFNIYFNVDKQLCYDANGISTIISTSSYLDSRWHHLAVSVNHNGNAVFYIDGLAKASRPGSTIGGLSGRYFSLGACEYSMESNLIAENYFKGSVDEFRYWQMSRNEELINLYRLQKLIGNEPGLSAYYPLDTLGANFIVKENLRNLANQTETAVIMGNSSFGEGAAVKIAKIPENIPFSWASNRDKIVISLTENSDYVKRMENCILTVSVKEIRDKNGNPSEPVSWPVYIDKNQLRWSESEYSNRIAEGEGLTFSVTANNASGSVCDFTIGNLPSWLTVNTASGKIQPRSNSKLTFTLNKNVPIGDYEQQILLNGKLLSDALKVRVKVAAQKPDWKINPANFDQSMNIIGRVKIDGYYSTDQEDIVAAFVNDTCAGLTSPVYLKEFDAYYIFMDVYKRSDNPTNTVTFSFWDASTGRIYPKVSTSEIIRFENDRLYGNMIQPVLFETSASNIEQSIDLNKGWNWISFNVNSDKFDNTDQFLSSITYNGKQIKSIDNYSDYADGKWRGSLMNFGMGKLYKMNMINSAQLKINGPVADTKSTPVFLNKGWSWIGYLPQRAALLNEALANLNATEGDIIKGQSSFAVYTGHNGWMGTLTYLQPGKGYLYHSPAKENLFYYPAITQSLRASYGVNAHNYRWSYNVADFSSNMTLTGVVRIAGTECAENYEVGVFDVDGKCRGREILYKDEDSNRYYLYLTILGDESGNDLILKLYDDKQNQVLDINEKLTYFPDMMLGTYKDPYVLTVGSNTGSEHLIAKGIRIYPNPTSGKLLIDSGNLPVKIIKIFDISGQLIQEIQDIQDYAKILDLTPFVNGVYMVEVDGVIYKIIKN